MRVALALALFGAAILVGCIQSGSTGAASVPLRTLDVGTHSGVAEPTRALILNEAAWDEFWARHAPGQTRPAVDFPREAVVAVALGERSAGCWEVRVTGARMEGQEAIIDVSVYDEGRAQSCASATTSAFHFVALDTRPGGVRFIESRVLGHPSA